FRFLNAPVELLGDEKGKITALKVEIMALGEPDEKGRRKPVGTGEFETIEVSSVICATGQQIDWGSLDVGNLRRDAKDRAIAHKVTCQSDEPDIFVGGDVYTGPKFAIDAIAAGREGATSIHRFVQPGQLLTLHRNLREFIELDKENAVMPLSYDEAMRQVPGKDASKALTFSDDRLPFTEAQVKKEAARCLSCGACVVDENRCIGCGLCTTKCQFDAIHLRRDHPECSTMVKAEDKLKVIGPYALKRAARILKKKK
ncbi:MAG: 4Fe-4S binding protein, partial [Oscillospiraceae bacterium]|nr:4Fe-4S binding protein [Oscillospiraceae bacterium]